MEIEKIFDFEIINKNVYLINDSRELYEFNHEINFTKLNLLFSKKVCIKKLVSKIVGYIGQDSFLIDELGVKVYPSCFIVDSNESGVLLRLVENGKKVFAFVTHNDIKNKLWELPFYSTIYLLSNQFYAVLFDGSLNKQRMIKINCQDGSSIWEYKIPETNGYTDSFGNYYEAQITSIINHFNGIIWIVSNSGKLIGINAETGIEVYSFVKPHNYVGFTTEEISALTFGAAYVNHFVKEEAKFFSLDKYYYVELDLSLPSPEITVFNCKTIFEESSIKMSYGEQSLSECDSYILFEHLRMKEFETPIGIFDREKKEVIWNSIDHLPERPYFGDIKKMKLKDNKIFILEKSGDFYIFNVELP
jgi:hypothetical protein